MKLFTCSVAFALAALAVLNFVGPVAAGDQVPFNGTLEGSFTVIPVPPPDINRQLDATGNATQLGSFTYDFPHSVDRSVMPATGVGISIFTAANGDQVFAMIYGEAMLFAPGLLLGVEEGMIVGGNGRFENATGSFVIERLIDTVNLTTIGSFKGTIASPGANRQ